MALLLRINGNPIPVEAIPGTPIPLNSGDTVELVNPEQAVGMQLVRSGNSLIITYAEGTVELAGFYGNPANSPVVLVLPGDPPFQVTQTTNLDLLNGQLASSSNSLQINEVTGLGTDDGPSFAENESGAAPPPPASNFAGDSGAPIPAEEDDTTEPQAPQNAAPPSEFSITSATVREGAAIVFTVTRTGGLGPASIDFATSIGAGDTASLADFTQNNGTLTFANGESSKTITVQTTFDGSSEGSETFTVTLSNASGAGNIPTPTATGTILDNTPPSASADNVAVDEDAVTVNLAPVLLGNDSETDAGDVIRILSVDTAGTVGTVTFDATAQTLTYAADDPALDLLAPGGATLDTTFTYTIVDSGNATSTATVTVTVSGVNDAPSVQGSKAVTVLEDAANTPLAITAPSDIDTGDFLTITVTATPNAPIGTVFLSDGTTPVGAGPLLASDLTGLVFRPASNANGAAGTFTYEVADLFGGLTSQTVTLGVTQVNDVPSFGNVAGSDQAVGEDAGAQTVGSFANSILAGPPNEAGQLLTFVVSNNNNGLFAVQPSINAAGTLVYTPAANATGTATVTVQLMDNGGTANLGVDTSAPQTFDITVNASNDAPSITGTLGGTAFTEVTGTAVALVATGTVSDVDATAGFNTGTLTVRLDAYNPGDELFVNGALTIGTASGGLAADLVITLNATATPATVQTLLGNLRYRNTGEDPTVNGTDANRVVSVVLNDGGNTGGAALNSNTLTGTMSLTGANDAPSIGGTLSAAFTEDGGPVALISAATTNDPDAVNFNGGTLTVSLDTFRAGDTLSVAGGTTIGTVSGGVGANLVITLNATATEAAVQTLMQQLRYENTGNNPTLAGTDTNRVVSVILNDGGNTPGAALNSNTFTGTVTVTGLNDSPSATADAASVNKLSSAVVSVLTNDTDPDGDTLTITAINTVAVVAGNIFNLVTNTVGAAPAPGTAAFLTVNVDGTLTYTPNGEPGLDPIAPGTATDTFQYTVTDAGAQTATASVTMTITANSAPVANPNSYAGANENATFTVVDGGTDLIANDTDTDGPTALAAIAETVTSTQGASVIISANGSFSFNPAAATALQALAAGASVNDTFLYQVTDGVGGGGPSTGTATVTVTGLNDAPTLDNTDTPVFTAAINEDNGAPTGVVGTLVSDLVDAAGGGGFDNISDVDTGALTGIAITAANTTNGAWFFSINNGTNWTALGAVATNARLLLADANSRLYFQPNANFNGPVTTALTFKAWDATTGANGSTVLTTTTAPGGTTTAFSTASDTIDITVTAVNDAPSITGTLGGTAFTEVTGTAVALVASATASDVDATNFNTGTLTVRLDGYQPGDELFVNGGTTIGSVSGGLGADLVITLNATATAATVQTLLGQLRYRNTGEDPTVSGTDANRVVSVVLNDGGNTGGAALNSNTLTGTMTVTGANDAPSIGGTLSAAFTEDGGPVALISAATTNDADALNFNTGTLTVSLDTFRAGDVLSLSTGTTPIGTVSGGVGANLVITLNATATEAAVATLLGNLRYENTGNNPTLAGTDTNRVVSVILNDGGNTPGAALNSNTFTGTVTVTGLNDAPSATADTASVNKISSAVVSVLANDTDPDGDTLTITAINTVAVAATNIFNLVTNTVVGVAPLSGSAFLVVNADGTLTYNPNGEFNPTAPGTANDTFDYTVTDAGAQTSTASVAMTITANAAPVANSNSYSGANENATFTVVDGTTDLIANDTDTDGPTALAAIAETVTSTQGASVTISANGSFSFNPTAATALQALAAGTSVNDTFLYQVTDGAGGGGPSTGTATVTVTGLNDAPTLDNADTPVFTAAINEDNGAPTGIVGTLVSDLVDAAGGGGFDNISDVDTGALTGIAITAANTTNGAWFFSINNGTNWTALGAVATNARLLLADANSRLYFQPNANFNGPVTTALTFKAWDATTGANGSTVLTTTTAPGGTTTAFSTASDTIDITVTAVNDAPSITGTLGGTAFTEVTGTAVALVASATASDVDATNFNTGTLTVRLDGYQPGDELFVNGGTTIGSVSGGLGADLVITLNATATAATVQTLLGQLRYRNTGEDPTVSGTDANRVVSVVLNDGGNTGGAALNSNTLTGTMTVTGANDAPSIGGTLSAAFTEDGGPVALISAATTNDADALNFNTGTLTVSLDTFRAGDVLSLSTGTTPIGTVSGGVGANLVITLNATATEAAVATLLGNLRYENTGNNPTLAGTDTNRVVSVILNDGGNTPGAALNSNTFTGTVTVTGLNDAPSATADTASVNKISSAVVSVLANDTDPDGDTLTITAINTVAVAATNIFNLVTNTVVGVAPLSGSAFLVVNADGTLTYNPNGEFNPTAPGTANDTFDYTVTDAGAQTSTASVAMTITANAAPVANSNSYSGANENATFTVVDGTTDLIANDTDTDGPTALAAIAETVTSTQGASVTISANGSFSFNPTAATALQALAAGTSVNDTFLYQVTDGAGGGGPSTGTATVTVTGLNDAPTLDNADTPVFTAAINEDNGAPTGIVGTLVSDLVDAAGGGGFDNISDVDTGALTGIAITAANTTNGAWFFSINNGTNWTALGAVATNARLLLADANSRLYFQPNANFNGPVTTALTFKAWDATTGANGSTVLTTTTAPGGTTTAFSTASDTIDITVTAVNDAPSITGTLGGTAFTEVTGTAVALVASATASDVDATNFNTGTLTVRLDGYQPGDELFVNGGTTIGSVSGGLGADLVITLNATATAATVQTLLGQLRYRNTGEDPTVSGTDANRVVSVVLNDGGNTGGAALNSNTLTGTMTVTGANDAPSIGGTLSAAFTEDGGPVALISAATTNDADALNFNTGTLTVSLDTFRAGDVLSLSTGTTPIGTVSGGVGANLVITLNATATEAAVATLLGNLRYENTGNNPTLAGTDTNRVVSVILNDGGNTPGAALNSNTFTGTVTVTGLNDAPSATADTASVNKISSAVVSVLANDTDPDGDTLTITAINTVAVAATNIFNLVTNTVVGVAPLSGSAFLVVNADGTLTYNPNGEFNPTAPGTANDTFDYTVTDAGAQTSTASVAMTITANAAPVANSNSYSGANENATFTVVDGTTDLIANDTDTDGPTALAAIAETVTSTQGASVTISANGSFSFNPTAATALQALAAGTSVNDTFLYQVTDGAGGGGPSTGTATVTVTGLNDAPTLDNADTPVFTAAINEDNGAPTGIVGTLVSDLVDAAGGGGFDNISDVDTGALTGIAITAANTTNGAWFFSINNGTNWTALGAVATNARLLLADANSRLYFQPNANFNGPVTTALTFKAWDATTGANGSTVLTTTTAPGGTTTAFSTASDTIDITVTAVNDAPSITGTLGGTAFTEVTGTAVALVASATASDVDATNFNTGTLTVRLDGYQPGDELFVNGGTTIGSVSGGLGADLVITLNATATAATVQTLLGQLRYRNTGEDPTVSGTDANRVVSVVLNDGGNTGGAALNSNTLTGTMTVTGANDAPSIGGTLSAAFTEDGGPVALISAATTNDADALNFNTGTLTVSLDTFRAGDVLSLSTGTTPIGTVSGGVGANLVITLNATATEAAVATLLGNLRYENTGNNPTLAGTDTNRVVSVILNDGGNTPGAALNSNTFTGTVTVTGLNDAPSATADTASVNKISSAVVSVLANDTDPDGDTLTITAINTVAVAATNIFNLVTNTVVGVAPLSGSAFLVVNADGTLTYNPNGEFNPTAPGTANDTFDYTVTDAGAQTSTASVAMTITANAAPVANSNSYSGANENATFTVVDGTTDLIANDTDTDGPTALAAIAETVTSTQGASVTISANGSFSFNPTAATALQALAAGTSVNDTFLYQVTDGAGGGGPSTGTATVTVTGLNDAPTLDNADTPVFTAAINEDNGAPTGIVGTLVSDLVDAAGGGGFDNISDVDTGALTGIAITAANTTNGAWFFSINNGTNWTALGAVATNARLLLADANSRLYFQPNANFNGPVTTALTFKAWDATTGANGSTVLTTTTAPGGTTTAFSTASDTIDITVTAVNDAPSITGTLGGTAFTEVTGTAVALVASATASDVDATNFNTGTLTVRLDGYQPGDELFVNGGTTIGSVSGGLGADLVITLNATATAATVQTLLGQLRYRNTGEDPTVSGTDANRVVSVVLNDGGNTGGAALNSNTLTGTMTVTGANDAPSIGGTLSAAFTEDGGPVALISAATTNDADALNFNTGTLTVSLDTFRAGDVLSLSTGTTPIGTVSGGVGANLVITLNATATEAAVATLLGNLRYENTGNNPTLAGTDTNRVVSVILNDGGNTPGAALNSNTFTGTVTVTGLNDAPSATADTASVNKISSAVVSVLANDTDPDGDTLTITAINTVAVAATNIFNLVTNTVVGAAPLSGSAFLVVNADGTLTYNPNGEFNPTAPGTANDTFDYTVTDAGAQTSTASVAMTITANAAPVANSNSYSGANENATFTVVDGTTDLIANDTDTDGPTALAAIAETVTSTQGASVTISANGSFSFNPTAATALQALAAGTSVNDTFLYQVTDGVGGGGPSTGTATVTVTGLNDAPTLDNADTPVFTAAINEDNGAPTGIVGTLVSDLVDAAGGGGFDNISDVDTGALTGIAITAANTTNGAWFFSINNGTNWTALGAVATNARLLLADANSRLYFQPNANFNGPVTTALTFKAWDATTGANGSTVLTTTTAPGGTTTAFSTASDTIDITVTAVNDAPSITGTLGGTAFTEVTGTAVALVASATASDVDATNFNTGTLTVRLDGYQPGDELFVNGGTTIGSVSGGLGADLVITLNATATAATVQTLLGQLRYRNTGEDPTVSGTDANRVVSVVLNDGGNTGGAALNSNTLTGTMSVTGANDAPSIGGTLSAAFTEDGGPVALISAATTNDADAVNFNTGTLTVSLDTFRTGDTLTVAGGTTIGSVSGGGGTNLVITLNATATEAAVATLMGQLRYENTGNNPTLAGTDAERVVSVILNDGGNTPGAALNSNTFTGTVTLVGVNDSPSATADAASVNKISSAVVSVLANDTDPDGDTLTITAINAVTVVAGNIFNLVTNTVVGVAPGAGSAFLLVNANGTLTYNPNGEFNPIAPDTDTDSFQYTVTDAGAQTATATVTMTITGTPSTSFIDLAALDTTADLGIKLLGVSGNALAGGGDLAGVAVSQAGDVNGDGFADVVIGAMQGQQVGGNAGMTYVVYGHDRTTLQAEIVTLNANPGISLNALDGLNKGYSIVPAGAQSFLGTSVGGGGDVNGDGKSDVLTTIRPTVGAPVNTDRAYVVLGNLSSALDTLNGNGSTAVNTGFNPEGGFASTANRARLDGDPTLAAAKLMSIADAGDIDGDGRADILAGHPDANALEGSAFLVFGNSAATLEALASLDTRPAGTLKFTVTGTADQNVGRSVAAAGDVNGDGLKDFVISGVQAVNQATGKVYVVFGDTQSALIAKLPNSNTATGFNLNSLTGGSTGGFTITHDTDMQFQFGVSGSYGSGFSVSSAGDFNGDGYADLIIGMPMLNTAFKLGAAYIVYGGPGPFANVSLGALDGNNGFTIFGWTTAANVGARVGHSVAGVGDVNGDGFDDVLVGAPGANEAYLLFGAPKATWIGRLTTDIFGGDIEFGDLVGQGYPAAFRVAYTYFDALHNTGDPDDIGKSLLDGTNGVLLKGAVGTNTGFAVSGAGDVDGDGFADVLVGASTAQGGASTALAAGAGEAELVFGQNFDNKASFVATPNPTATANGQSLIGTSGVDTLDSATHTGVVHRAGAGNDTLIVNGSEKSVDAGGGFDTLKLHAGTTVLDFTALSNAKYAGIERVDLSGGASESISLNVRDLLDLSGQTHTLFIRGDAGDTVNALKLAGDTQNLTTLGWVRNAAGDLADPIGGGTFQNYDYVGTVSPALTVAHLLIDPDITLVRPV